MSYIFYLIINVLFSSVLLCITMLMTTMYNLKFQEGALILTDKSMMQKISDTSTDELQKHSIWLSSDFYLSPFFLHSKKQCSNLWTWAIIE